MNIVIDACAAGGSSFDVGTIIRPQLSGNSTSSSIAFLGACGADQDASEQNGHGFLTLAVLRCLRGEVEVQRWGSTLDLLEVGTVVSPQVEALNNQQRPLSWGLSLFGGSSFAKNPFFDAQGGQKHFPLPNISPFSSFGAKIREKSAELWEIHRELPTLFDPRRLLRALASILKDTADCQEKVALIEGLSASLTSRAAESDDLLAPSQSFQTCLISLLPDIDNVEVKAYLAIALQALLDRNNQLCTSILHELQKNEYYLLSSHSVAGELYYLPLRVSRLLGWIGADIAVRRLVPGLTQDVAACQRLASELVTQYAHNLVAVCDAQAAPLDLFLLGCQLEGWNDLARNTLTAVYASFCERKGNVTRWDATPEQAVQYILSLTDTPLKPCLLYTSPSPRD